MEEGKGPRNMCPLWGDHLSGRLCQENSLLAAPCRGTTHKAGAMAPWHGTWCGCGGSDCWSRGQGGLCPAEARLPCLGYPPRHTPAPLCWPRWRPGLRALRHTDAGCWEVAPWPPHPAPTGRSYSLSPQLRPDGRQNPWSAVSNVKISLHCLQQGMGNGQRTVGRTQSTSVTSTAPGLLPTPASAPSACPATRASGEPGPQEPPLRDGLRL